MALPRLAPKSVDFTAAAAAYEELVNFVDSRNPDVVDKKPDTAVDFDAYLKTVDLQKTNALIEDFLVIKGKRLAAEFLQAEDAKLVRSFVVLYCARHTRTTQWRSSRTNMMLD